MLSSVSLAAVTTVLLVVVYGVVVLEIARRAFVSARRGIGRAQGARGASPEVLVLRPVKGEEVWLEPNLERAVPLPGATECFSVGCDGDGAHALVTRAASQRPQAFVVVGERDDLPNPKVAHLAHAYAARRAGDLVAVVDADVVPATIDGDAVVAAFDSGRVEAVWQPVVEGPGDTFGDALSEAILLGSFHAFPLLGLLDRGGLVGKVSAVRRRTLEALGGFEALGHVLGEDMELAAAIRARGGETAMVAGVARSSARGRSVRQVFDRFVRWTLVTKSQRPSKLLSYPLFFFPLPIVMMLAVCMQNVVGAGCLGVMVFFRGMLVVLGALRSGAVARIPRVLALALLADLVLFAAWVRALTLRTVIWRGTRMRFAAGGRLARADA